MRELEPILKYKMDEVESKAYKIAIMWQEECERELPKEQTVKLKKNSDPRKSTLFKYCYKLAKEMKGILPDNDFRFYIRAQIQILKSIREGEIHALVEPHCLVGEKAWKRWKVWKSKYQRKLRESLTSDEMEISAKDSKVIGDLENSFNLLSRRGCLVFEELEKNQENIGRWVSNGELSCYYMVISPWMRKIFGDLDEFNFDKTYYRSAINPHIDQFFRTKFSHEYL
jgi:hypothetical protein